MLCKRCAKEESIYYRKWCQDCFDDITNLTDDLVLKLRNDLDDTFSDKRIKQILQVFASDMDEILTKK